MKQFKYYILMLFIILVEIGIIYILFIFANASKILYVVISLLILFSGIFYIFYTRYREKINIKPKKEVLAGYRRIILYVALFIVAAVVCLIFLRGIVFMLFSR